MKIWQEWDYEQFGRRLRRARTERLPVWSQREVAERVGVTESMVSRWHNETAGANAPTLDQCAILAEMFDEFDFVELAKVCGRWNDEVERLLVDLTRASTIGVGNAKPAIPRYLKPLPALVLGDNVIPLPTGRALQRVA